jgi:hypothetical protein
MPVAARRAVNEAVVRQFFGASDPAWRWVLILAFATFGPMQLTSAN